MVIFTTSTTARRFPNTITAKTTRSFRTSLPVTHPGAWINFLGDQLSADAHAWKHFAPFYEAIFTIHSPIPYGVAKGVAALVAALAIIGAVSTFRRWSWLPAIAYLPLGRPTRSSS